MTSVWHCLRRNFVDDHPLHHQPQIQKCRMAAPTVTAAPAGVLAAVGSRYEYTGGSARWMFNYSRKKIDSLLDQYCQEPKNCKAILQGEIGPTSDPTTNYFFGSAKANGQTNIEYFLVSKRAVQILSKRTKGLSYESLYQVAKHRENPSFMDWVVQSG